MTLKSFGSLPDLYFERKRPTLVDGSTAESPERADHELCVGFYDARVQTQSRVRRFGILVVCQVLLEYGNGHIGIPW
jgi:hypothetical protein